MVSSAFLVLLQSSITVCSSWGISHTQSPPSLSAHKVSLFCYIILKFLPKCLKGRQREFPLVHFLSVLKGSMSFGPHQRTELEFQCRSFIGGSPVHLCHHFQMTCIIRKLESGTRAGKWIKTLLHRCLWFQLPSLLLSQMPFPSLTIYLCSYTCVFPLMTIVYEGPICADKSHWILFPWCCILDESFENTMFLQPESKWFFALWSAHAYETVLVLKGNDCNCQVIPLGALVPGMLT